MRLWLLSILALATGLASARADRVDEYLASEMANHRIPGACLLVVQTNTTVKRASYGLANLELKVPVTADTLFEIGSLTKQFTAACILLLAQDGKLSVDDKIEQHLPQVPRSWHDITIRQLLTHTSGIKSYTGLDGFELRRHLTQQQFIAALAVYPLEFEPGHSFKYCNSGYSLLGYIVENVSGKTYWDFLADRILHPLDMVSTRNRSPAQILPNRASGYEQTNHVWINRDYDLTDVFSAGAIASTTGDLAKWNASLDASTLLTRETQRQMWTPEQLKDGTETKYGFGWRIEEFEGHRNIGHGGATSGFSASLQRFPDDHLAVILLTNTDEQVATAIARNVARFYFK
jgi:D-alanyl-D-alanine carboxypeptidase